MAITPWTGGKAVGANSTLFERLRAWAFRLLMRFDIAMERRRVHKIAAREAAQDRRRLAKIEAEKARADRIKKSSLRRELARVERAVSLRLTLLEFAHWSRPNRNGKYRISRIRFAERVATPSRVFLRVDTVRLPRGRGITTQNLMQQEVLDELGLAVGAPVSYERHYERGFWFIVDLGGKLSAIPSLVERREAVEQMPKTAQPLDVPFGVGNYRRFYHVNLENTPHMIVAGATGFGKSVFIHNIITYIIENTTCDQVRLALADLKGGAELSRYDGVPHLWECGGSKPVEQRVYTRRDEVLDLLRAVLYEVERRLQMFAGERVSKLSTWNQKHHSRKLPRILVVIDEIQNAMLDSRSRGDMETVLVDIASRARATGIHVVIATQRPSTDVITGLIKANFPARVALNCFSIHDSKTILDTTEAANLGRPGLLVYRGEGNKHFRCQSPWLTEGMIEEIITNAIEGTGGTVETRNVGIPDLIRWAIEENGGVFTIDAVYQMFRPQGITYQEVRDVWAEFSVKGNIVEFEGRRFEFRQRDSRLIEIDQDGVPVSELTIIDLARWAINEKGGAFSLRKVVKQFRHALTEPQFRQMCKRYEGSVVSVDGIDYKLMPGNGGNKPRKWVQV